MFLWFCPSHRQSIRGLAGLSLQPQFFVISMCVCLIGPVFQWRAKQSENFSRWHSILRKVCGFFSSSFSNRPHKQKETNADQEFHVTRGVFRQTFQNVTGDSRFFYIYRWWSRSTTEITDHSTTYEREFWLTVGFFLFSYFYYRVWKKKWTRKIDARTERENKVARHMPLVKLVISPHLARTGFPWRPTSWVCIRLKTGKNVDSFWKTRDSLLAK